MAKRKLTGRERDDIARGLKPKNSVSFYQQVKTFFLKNDPGRVRLARKIASTFKSEPAQKVVMKRLVEVYSNGGPEQLKIMPKTSVKSISSKASEEE